MSRFINNLKRRVSKEQKEDLCPFSNTKGSILRLKSRKTRQKKSRPKGQLLYTDCVVQLFYSNALSQVTRFIDVVAAADGDIISQQLQGNDSQDGNDKVI